MQNGVISKKVDGMWGSQRYAALHDYSLWLFYRLEVSLIQLLCMTGHTILFLFGLIMILSLLINLFLCIPSFRRKKKKVRSENREHSWTAAHSNCAITIRLVSGLTSGGTRSRAIVVWIETLRLPFFWDAVFDMWGQRSGWCWCGRCLGLRSWIFFCRSRFESPAPA